MIAQTLALLAGLTFSATAQFNGQTCALPAGSYVTAPLLELPVCGGWYVCQPGGTVYNASATMVVMAACKNDRIANSGFEP